MRDNLDNELKNRIREVFDNYEDASTDAGWEKLRQKFPEKKKRRIVPLWWLSTAAVLLLALGLWFFMQQQNKPQQVAYHKSKTTKPLNSTFSTADKNNRDNALNNRNTTGTINGTRPGETNNNTDQRGARNQNSLAAIARIQKRITVSPGPVLTNIQHPGQLRIAGNNSVKGQDGYHSFNDLSRGKSNKTDSNNSEKGLETIFTTPGVATAKKTTDTVADISETKIARQQVKEPTPALLSAAPKQDAVLNMIAADKARQETTFNQNKKRESAQDVKSVVLSVYAATYFNYAKGSKSDLNVGAGFTSDFKLNDNFKLSTGVAIAQNSLSYNSSQVPSAVNTRVFANITSRNFSADLSNSFATAAVTPSLTNYNASLIGLDIPLNIKYQLKPQGDTYILAGISSGTFINETYRSTVAYPNYLYGLATGINGSPGNTTQESTTKSHFGSFDFAKTLNFSFGVGYPLGKYNRLIIEPFLKYPLSGLGAEDIRFGAGGVNLKLNFKAGKK